MHSLCDNLNHGARDDRVGCRCVRRKIKTLSYIHEIKGRLDVRKHPRDTMRQFGHIARVSSVLVCTRPRARLGPRAAHMAPPRRVTTSAPGERSSIHAQLARTNQTNTSTFRPARRLRRLDSPNLIHGTRGSTGQHLQTDKARTGANLHRNCTTTSTACVCTNHAQLQW